MDIKQAVLEALEELGVGMWASDCEAVAELVEEKFKSTNTGSMPCSCQVAPTNYVNMITLKIDADCPYHGEWHEHSTRTKTLYKL